MRTLFLAVSLLCVALIYVSCHKDESTPADPTLSADKQTISLPVTFYTDTIHITSNIAWVITGATDWLTVSPSSGSGNATVYLQAKENTTADQRKANLLVSPKQSGSLPSPVQINVTQEQPGFVLSGYTTQGKGGDIFVVYGTGFSPNVNDNKVIINGSACILTMATTTQLTGQVPNKAGSGKVQVIVNTKSVTGDYDFHYMWFATVTEFVGTGIDIAPEGIKFDSQGNLYVADYGKYKIEKFSPDGTIMTVLPGIHDIPYGDYNLPSDIAIDKDGTIYVTEYNQNAIDKISTSGEVTQLAGGDVNMGFADGYGVSAKLYRPFAIVIDSDGNLIFSDQQNNAVRKLDVKTNYVSTLAGGTLGFADGNGIVAKFNSPSGLIADKDGNYLVCDLYNDRIRKVTPQGVVTTFAAKGSEQSIVNGTIVSPEMYHPVALTQDTANNIYFSETFGDLRWIRADGYVENITPDIQFSNVNGLAVDRNGVLYVSDYFQKKIYKLTLR